VKGFLIGCSVLLVLGIAAIFVLVSKGTELVTKGRQMREQGAAFGRYVSESECLAEAVTRYRKTTGIVNGMTQAIWLGGCLEPSTKETDFCVGVPPMNDREQSISWRLSRCAAEGFNGDSACANIFEAVEGYCTSAERQKKMARAR